MLPRGAPTGTHKKFRKLYHTAEPATAAKSAQEKIRSE